MKYFVVFFAAIFSVLTTGCGTTGERFSIKDISTLKVGVTSKQQADSIIGKPLSEETVLLNNVESVLYFYGFSQNTFEFLTRMNKKNLHLEFIDNTLNGIIYNNSFDDTSTNFNADLRNKLVPYQTTKEDIFSLLGKNAGIVRLPSNLLIRSMPEQYIRNIPPNTKEIIVYFYSYMKELFGGQRYANNFKIMLIFLDEHNIYIDKVYVENISHS